MSIDKQKSREVLPGFFLEKAVDFLVKAVYNIPC